MKIGLYFYSEGIRWSFHRVENEILAMTQYLALFFISASTHGLLLRENRKICQILDVQVKCDMMKAVVTTQK